MKSQTTIQWFLLLSMAAALAGCGTSGQQATEAEDTIRFPSEPLSPVAGNPQPIQGVTVLKYDDTGAPQAGAAVVYQEPTGAILAESLTAADGKTETALPNGGDVTVPYDWTGFRAIETVTGARNGMFLAFNTGAVAQTSPDAGVLEVTIPGNFAGTNVVQIETGCAPVAYLYPAFGDVTAHIQLDEACAAAPVSVLASAMDVNAETIAWTHALDVTIGGSAATVVELGAWRTDWAMLPVAIGQNAAGTSMVSFEGQLLRGGHRFGYAYAASYTDALDTSVKFPAGFAEGLTYVAAVYGSAGGSKIDRRNLTAPASVSLTGADFLPAVTVTGIDLSDATRPAISWTTAGGVSPAVGVELTMMWQSPTLSSDWYSWRVIAQNSSRNSLKMPILPASAAPNGPQAQMEGFTVSISMVEYSDLGTYEEVAPAVLGATPAASAMTERTIRTAFSY